MSEKRSLLEELKKRDPDLLKLLEEVARVFGKTERTVRIIEGGED